MDSISLALSSKITFSEKKNIKDLPGFSAKDLIKIKKEEKIYHMEKKIALG